MKLPRILYPEKILQQRRDDNPQRKFLREILLLDCLVLNVQWKFSERRKMMSESLIYTNSESEVKPFCPLRIS